MNTPEQTLFEKFDKRPKRYVALMIFAYLFINNTINATSNWMEATRDGATPQFMLWEPFSWEYTSALSTMLLLPVLFFWFRTYTFNVQRVWQFIGFNVLISIVFSACHVGLMVGFREIVYFWMGGNYDFGSVGKEFFYEYRKDAWGFLFFMLLYYVYQFIYSRLKGEASLISERELVTQDPAPNHLLVKKLDREFLVNVSDIEWLEAAGNYVNLHAQGRIYPLRSTLSGLLPRIEEKGFIQVHRSQGVNLNQIDSISSLPSGDGEILLKSGKTLSLSRRYKEAFKKKVK